MKKLFTVFFTTVFLFGSSSAQAAFPDVPSNHPYAEAIEYVQSQGYVSGDPSGNFRPDDKINRAEFIKILIEAVFDDATITACRLLSSNLFRDVLRTIWFAKYVCIAKTNLIISGYPDKTFRGINNILFAEAAKIVVNSFGLPLGPSGPQWYDTFMNALKAKNAIPDEGLSPAQEITRGEMAEIIYRLVTPVSPVSGEVETFRQKVVDLVNVERQKQGLPTLKRNSLLDQAAQVHSDDMQQRDYFSHISPEGNNEEKRIKESGYLQPFFDCACNKSYTVGENLAKGQQTPEEAMTTWMNSPGHRANILSPDFSEIGIAISKITEQNNGNFIGYFWVQTFGNIKLEGQ